jgi:hypothetical protein
LCWYILSKFFGYVHLFFIRFDVIHNASTHTTHWQAMICWRLLRGKGSGVNVIKPVEAELNRRRDNGYRNAISAVAIALVLFALSQFHLSAIWAMLCNLMEGGVAY